jgi:hypothetical protein
LNVKEGGISMVLYVMKYDVHPDKWEAYVEWLGSAVERSLVPFSNPLLCRSTQEHNNGLRESTEATTKHPFLSPIRCCVDQLKSTTTD